MWLLRPFPVLARVAGHVYYRLRLAGEPVPRSGPVLLVANHPNSLLDPMLVCAAARRPVRFLAKAPLFADPKLGWLMRAVGAIPVYRREDNPELMHANVDTFRAVREALRRGSAVGIFPEGKSHSDPSLAALKTGAARIALGAAHQLGHPIAIVPIGLMFRAKDVFRSSALVLVGPAVQWADLAARSEDDADAVRELTARIADGLRRVTVNLERWADRPLVECAQRIWEAAYAAQRDAGSRAQRLVITAKLLSEVRREGDERWARLVADVRAHCRRLARLRLAPGSLGIVPEWRVGLRWAAARVPLGLPFAVALAVGGMVLFAVPYWLTRAIVNALPLLEDQRSTWKLLGGMVLHGLWVTLLAVGALVVWNVWTGAALFVSMPVVGVSGLVIRERWRGAWGDAHRFFLLRSRRRLVAALQSDQERLAARLHELVRERLAKGAL